jgi:hypothetical protein
MLARMPKSPQPLAGIAATIRLVRGQRVLLDVDLALVYGVTTKRLNEQVRRNAKRVPADFLIRSTKHDLTNLRSQIATSSWGGRRIAAACPDQPLLPGSVCCAAPDR